MEGKVFPEHAPKKTFLSRNRTISSNSDTNTLDDQRQSTLDLLSNSMLSKRVHADSLSNISLPDDLRISFSEIEEGSLHLEDIDFTCPSSVEGDSMADNTVTETSRAVNNNRDNVLANSSRISSTSENQRFQQNYDFSFSENHNPPPVSSGSQMYEFPYREGGKDGNGNKFGDSKSLGVTSSSKMQTTLERLTGSSSNGCEDVYKTESETGNQSMWNNTMSHLDAPQVSTIGSSGQALHRKKSIQRRSSKNKHMENVSCQVCGDVAAGFYCGAFICEACKKFYMRAYKQDKLKYACLREKNCVITKESRVQCQYCRFQKCIQLNMYCPKQGEAGESKKDMHMADIPCRVCSAPSSGFHFGAITCEGCKGFFRRMAKEREPEKYQCNKRGLCEINMITRNLCKACRYQSCIKAGMSVEGSRIGRQPNSVKHAMSMELKHCGKMEKSDGDSINNMPFSIKEEPVEMADNTSEAEKSNSAFFWDSWNESSNQMSDAISAANQIISDTNSTSSYNSQPIRASSVSDSINSGEDNFILHTLSNDTTPVNLKSSTANNWSLNIQSDVNCSQSQSEARPNWTTPSHTATPIGTPAQRLIQQSVLNAQQHRAEVLGTAVAAPLSSTAWNPPRAPSPKHSRQQEFNKTFPKLSVSMSKIGPRYMPNQPPQPPTDDLEKGTEEMEDFISKIIEAGKCLQLLNYRVFDTDLNPTASMNVDEIKTLFKSKYMDPKAGNTITSSVDMDIYSSRESTWSYMMTNFHHNTYITIRFAKMIPGFKTLSLNDQVKLIQSSIYPIELLNMSKVYDPTTKQYNYFTYTKEEENIMMEQFPMLRVIQEHFLHIGEMVAYFQLTDEEFALLSALLLFPSEIHGLEDPKAVEVLQTEISWALQYYEERHFPDGLTRYGVLLVRVAELVQCLLQHNLAIGLLLTHNPSIKVPQLFHELIIESIKEAQ